MPNDDCSTATRRRTLTAAYVSAIIDGTTTTCETRAAAGDARRTAHRVAYEKTGSRSAGQHAPWCAPPSTSIRKKAMTATRLLILGVLRQQPQHGYDVRRTLELWNAEHWANIAYGSIYFALGKMEEEGLVDVIGAGQVGRRPARTTYAITPAGHAEFQRLLREYWWEYKPTIDPLQVAITFAHALPREDLLAAIQHRSQHMRAVLPQLHQRGEQLRQQPGMPGNIFAGLALASMQIETTLAWMDDLIGQIERGELP
ncbi:PadR family transcriptional regulator [Chloroflexia bacterium SDU3-3]|nr:PadR family transcriptional regulator [Chloroflexia bacterium SDU3-3]